MNAKKPWIVPPHSSGESDGCLKMNLCSERGRHQLFRTLLEQGWVLDLDVLPAVRNIINRRPGVGSCLARQRVHPSRAAQTGWGAHNLIDL
jgi:hypothetical protein